MTTQSRRRLVVILGLIGLGAGLAYWFRPARTLPIPAVADEVQDLEVRKSLEEHRTKVIQSPRSAEAWGELGLAFLAQLFDRDADTCFAEAARLEPDDVRWPYARGVIATKRDPAQAVPFLRQAASATKPTAKHRSNARLLLAETLLEQRQLDDAEVIFREEAQSSTASTAARAQFGLGLTALARGDLDRAWTSLLTARDYPSSRKQATIQLASLARLKGDLAAATKYEQETVTLPDDVPWPDPMLDELGRLKVGRRVRERTIEDLEQEKRYEEAAAAYLRQIDERPTVQAYTGAAVNYARMQDYDTALQMLKEALRLDPDSSQAYYTRAIVEFTRAEKESARQKDSEKARQGFKDAVAAARKATELKPDHSQAFLLWGLALKNLNDWPASIEPLRRGVTCKPESFGLQLALGEALAQTGNSAEAEKVLITAKSLDPNDPRPGQILERLPARKP